MSRRKVRVFQEVGLLLHRVHLLSGCLPRSCSSILKRSRSSSTQRYHRYYSFRRGLRSARRGEEDTKGSTYVVPFPINICLRIDDLQRRANDVDTCLPTISARLARCLKAWSEGSRMRVLYVKCLRSIPMKLILSKVRQGKEETGRFRTCTRHSEKDTLLRTPRRPRPSGRHRIHAPPTSPE